LRGLPLKRFANWRAKFKDEDLAPCKLLWRRGDNDGFWDVDPRCYAAGRRIGD
jgi:hypothetical protein